MLEKNSYHLVLHIKTSKQNIDLRVFVLLKILLTASFHG
jgi:hypothetical protein